MKKYTVISTIGDPMNITSLLGEKGIKHIHAGEQFSMYPTIVITNMNGDFFPQVQVLASVTPNPYMENRVDSYWLSPFRNYSFQVSSTITGDFNMGESPVVGLGNIICADYKAPTGKPSMPNGAFISNTSWSQMYHPVLTAFAKEALFNYALRLDHGNPRWNFFNYDAQKLLHTFIDLVVARLRGMELVPENPDFMGIVEENLLYITEVDDIEEFLDEQSAELVKLLPDLNKETEA